METSLKISQIVTALNLK